MGFVSSGANGKKSVTPNAHPCRYLRFLCKTGEGVMILGEIIKLPRLWRREANS